MRSEVDYSSSRWSSSCVSVIKTACPAEAVRRTSVSRWSAPGIFGGAIRCAASDGDVAGKLHAYQHLLEFPDYWLRPTISDAQRSIHSTVVSMRPHRRLASSSCKPYSPQDYGFTAGASARAKHSDGCPETSTKSYAHRQESRRWKTIRAASVHSNRGDNCHARILERWSRCLTMGAAMWKTAELPSGNRWGRSSRRSSDTLRDSFPDAICRLTVRRHCRDRGANDPRRMTIQCHRRPII